MRMVFFTGLMLFAVMLLGALFIYQTVHVNAASRVPDTLEPQSPFDGPRAYQDLEIVVGFGPRPSGSEALEECRAYIIGELEKAGLEVHQHAFKADTPLGPKPMVNIVGVVEGTEPGIIILGNHYETKYYTDFEFVGANDGGSTTAWMIEMARVMGPTREGRSLWLLFFDGEEAFVEWTEEDSLYGSREFVEYLEQAGRLVDVHAMINVDMIGDCYLTITRDRGAPSWLEAIIWDQAKELGYGQYFLPTSKLISDDHIPFRRRGIPAINIIDFMYGGSPLEHRRNWHTERDTIDRVCASSLQIVGDVIYHALPKVEAQLALE